MRANRVDDEGFTVGGLADATGLTVRALHHYDRLGLLVPSARTSGGHRRYSDADVTALYQIVALRGLGLSLAEIAKILQEEQSLIETLRRQLEQTEQMLDANNRLLGRLKRWIGAAELSDGKSSPELLQLIADTVAVAPPVPSHFTYRPADPSGAAILAAFFEGVTSCHEQVRALVSGLSPPDMALSVDVGSAWGSPFGARGVVGGLLVHVVAFEDDYVNRAVQSRAAIWEDGWSETVGLPLIASYRSCMDDAVSTPLPASFMLGAFKEYADAVFAATFDYVSHASDSELHRSVPGPASTALQWSMTVSELLAQVAAHSFMHAGQLEVMLGLFRSDGPTR